MAGKRHRVPAARQDDLVVEGFLDEVLVYDLQRNRAHCLNRTAALVWQNCDGRTTVAELAGLLASELEIPANEAMVWMALNRLSKARLPRSAGHPAGNATHLLAAGGDADIGVSGENLAHPAGGALDRHAVRSPSPDVPSSERMLGPAGLLAVQPRIGVCEEMLC